jgi:hypothetical protein
MAIDWGTVPAWITAGIAAIGTGFALSQLWLSRRAVDQQLQLANANLLLSIDGQFEGKELARSRKAIRALRNRLEAQFKASKAKNKSPEAEMKAVAEDFSELLDAAWRKVREFEQTADGAPSAEMRREMDRYYQLMALPNWMETVGMLCARNLIRTEDVLSLYAGVIVTTLFNFENHVKTRRVEGPHSNIRFLENAYALYDEAVAYRAKRDAPPVSRPLRSRLRWH